MTDILPGWKLVQRNTFGDGGHWALLETSIQALGAPLDSATYQEIWNCGFEARVAGGAAAALQHRSLSWRVQTLVILCDLFGEAAVPMGTMPDAAAQFVRRAAPIPRAHYGRKEATCKGEVPNHILTRQVQR